MINDYIKSMTKCSNGDCTRCYSCLRFDPGSSNKFNHEKCDMFFKKSDSDSVKFLKDMFGMR